MTPKAKPKAAPPKSKASPKAVAAAPAPAVAKAAAGGKLGAIIALLSQPDGATLKALMSATGWQIHSVRGALAGAVKKKGHTVVSEKTEGGRVYRIETAA